MAHVVMKADLSSASGEPGKPGVSFSSTPKFQELGTPVSEGRRWVCHPLLSVPSALTGFSDAH